MQIVRDDWDNKRHELRDALLFNRKLWNIFLTSVTAESSQLPDKLRENIANLGLFVMKQTVSMQDNPIPGKLDTLININRELAAGLRAAKSAADAG